MEDNLRSEERRNKIVQFLIKNRCSTREDLAREFNVSKRTITRDIVCISPKVPIYTKSGNQGGIYILPGYRFDREYLTTTEEICLRELMNVVQQEQRSIILGILHRFTMKIM